MYKAQIDFNLPGNMPPNHLNGFEFQIRDIIYLLSWNTSVIPVQIISSRTYRSRYNNFFDQHLVQSFAFEIGLIIKSRAIRATAGGRHDYHLEVEGANMTLTQPPSTSLIFVSQRNSLQQGRRYLASIEIRRHQLRNSIAVPSFQINGQNVLAAARVRNRLLSIFWFKRIYCGQCKNLNLFLCSR